MTFGAAILAGGENLRMGRDKASLTFNGETFLQHIAGELTSFDEHILSVKAPRDNRFGFKEIYDDYRGNDPMLGILTCLERCSSDALLFVSCDMPLFAAELGEYLCSLLSDEYDAVTAVSYDGQEHPLCAVYRKSAIPAFKAAAEKDEDGIFSALSNMRVLKAPIARGGFSDRLLTKINLPEDYARLCGACVTNIFLVGGTGSGKSDIIEVTTELLGKRLGGFETSLMRDGNGQQALYLFAPGESPANISSHIVAAPSDSPLQIAKRFNELGCAYLSASAGAELIIMDELGNLEKDAVEFRRAVYKALDSSTPVLGAINEGFAHWTNDLTLRSDLRTITVTEENRGTLPIVLANIISAMRPIKTTAAAIREAESRACT